jgi:hypothetical protein
MSNSPFAPITSTLLARKGDAMPSGAKPSLFWTRDVPPPPAVHETPCRAPAPPLPPDGAKPHRMMVTLSAGEFEKLGIAAVKKGLTRHQIVRAALDAHLERLKREYGGCGCMAMGTGCSDGCGA